MNIARNSVQVFLARVLRLSVSFAAGIMLARWLQPEGRGEYSLVTQFVVLAAAFGGMSINQATVHHSGSGRFSVENHVSNALSSAVVFSVLTAVAFLAFMGPLASVIPIDRSITLIILVMIPLTIFDTNLRAVLQSQHRFRWLNTLEIIQAVLFAVLVALCWGFFAPSLEGALLAWAVSAGVVLLVLFWMTGVVSRIRLKFDPGAFKSHLSFGLKTHISTVTGLLCVRFDQYILSYMSDGAAVGKYAIAVSLAELLLFVPASVSFVLFPKMAQDTDEESIRNIKKAFFWLAAIMAAVSLGLALMAAPIIEYGFGESYRESLVVVWILLPGIFMIGIASIIMVYFNGKIGKPYFGAIAAAVTLAVNTWLNFILIPVWGINGAAVSSTIAYCIGAGINIGFFLYFVKIKKPSGLRGVLYG